MSEHIALEELFAFVYDDSMGPEAMARAARVNAHLLGCPACRDACQALLDAQRPVGATVTAAAPGEVELDVSATVVITGSTTAETVRETFTARLKEYLAGVIKAKYDTIYYSPEEDTAYTVIYNRILALLLTIDGVENASSLTVNGGAKDVTIQANQVPVAGTVEVRE